MATFLHDVRYGLRLLARSPATTATAVLTLALGIGANSALFSVVNGVLLRPLPYQDAGRLVALWEHVPSKGWDREPLSYPDMLDWKAQTTAFERIAGYCFVGAVLGSGTEAEYVVGAAVSADLLPLLRSRPAIGRGFTPEEDAPGGPPAVVIGHGLWKRRFQSSPDLVGSAILLDGRGVTVVGVMPDGFTFPPMSSPRDYWIPLAADAQGRGVVENRGNHYMMVVARLRDGMAVEGAQAELAAVARRLETAYPDTNSGFGALVLPLHETFVGDVRRPLLVLLGAVGALLLIACANIANVLLARAASRRREIAVRAALGAGRARIARQLLVESLLLSLAGGAVGLVAALWGVEALMRLAPAQVLRTRPITLDLFVAGFTLAVCVATGVLCGLAPALKAAGQSLDPALREGRGGQAEGWRRNRVRAGLVVAEVALCLVLLVGAGLLLRSLQRVLAVDPGFDPRGVLAVSLSLPAARYDGPAAKAALYERLVEEVGALPGVRAAAVVYTLPLGGSNRSNSFRIVDREEAAGRSPDASYRSISSDYFRVMGIPLRRGRAFDRRDTAGAPRVAIVSESLARRFFPEEDPVGRTIETDEDPSVKRAIVGVVGDVRYLGLDAATEPEYYVPAAQAPEPGMTLVVKAAAEPGALGTELRARLRALDPGLPFRGVRSMEELMGQSVAPRRFSATLLGAFAAVALVLAATGLYGVLAYSVARRSREIGIRLAVGARPADILRMVVAQGMLLALAGLAAGLAGSLLLARSLSGLLFGVGAADPATLAGVSCLLAAVALLACWVPARRAARLDPMIPLRQE